MSGWEITNNTFIDSFVGMFIGGGRDNKLTNNHCPSTNFVSHTQSSFVMSRYSEGFLSDF